MGIIDVIKLLGGLALFFYGMTLMSETLKKVAGPKLERSIERISGNRFNGVGVGALVTGVIQSSSATTVMVVGFVNAGIMSLNQVVGIIMGANIGTTVTGQILRLSNMSSDNIVLQLLNPKGGLTPLLIAVGMLMILFCKKSVPKEYGHALVGLGLIFFGMANMEGAVSVLKDNEFFTNILTTFKSPVYGVLAGMLLTAVLQSSSASIGILQAMSTTGLVTFSMACPIILGQNIGTCITALLSSLSANKNAKRAALIHMYFNIIGTVLFLVAIYGANSLFELSFWNNIMDVGSIADFHTIFNIVSTLILLPFPSLLVKLSMLTLPESKDEVGAKIGTRLDERFLDTPAFAIEQSKSVAWDMGYLSIENFLLYREYLKKPLEETKRQFQENEQQINKLEAALNKYLVKISSGEITDTDSKTVTELLHIINDFERIGDYTENLIECVDFLADHKKDFSDIAKDELNTMADAVEEALKLMIEALSTESDKNVRNVDALEEVVDHLEETLREKHMLRLQEGSCSVDIGINFLDSLTNLERISDHCYSAILYFLGFTFLNDYYNPHVYKRDVRGENNTELTELTSKYMEKYNIKD